MGTEKKIRLLSNEPCRSDAFEGHSHEHIAEQVARLVREDDERHIIGIEGGWGSGKSNLISLVNIDLNGDTVYEPAFHHKDSTYPFFVYDAWGHQADYQRRAILEELTHDLTYEKEILDKEKWETELEGLLAKRKKVSTKEVPRLGVGLIVSLILTLLTPLVIFVISLMSDGPWWLRATVATLPYVAGIVYVVFDRIRSLKKNGQKCSFANIISEILLVYKDKIKENETYTTISEKEPSSAEFKTWMEKVDKDLGKKKKTLIIVFDNMDRLPSQKVESLWSSIHSFFSDKTYPHIKVLIPFDRQHVNKAFRNEDLGGESYGNDFINKTFDVVFRVPPPIMSDWQQYMESQWKDAFGKEEELSMSVVQIYDALSKVHTPRKIIAFINEVATIKMTLQETIPDRYIALFVFGKEAIEKSPIGELLNPSYMGDVKFEYERDADIVRYMSALYYQLPVSKSLDVVFTREATEALNTGASERLHQMMEHIDLSTILCNAVLKVNDVEKATEALAGIDHFIDYGDFGDMPDWLYKLWDDVYQKSKVTDVKWNEIKDFQVSLFTHLYNQELAESLVTGYLSIPDDKLDAKRYVEVMNTLRANNDIIDVRLDVHKRDASPKLFLELLKYTHGKYEDYGFSFNRSALDTYMSQMDIDELSALKVIPYIKQEKGNTFKGLIAKLKEYLEDNGVQETKRIQALFDRLKEVEDKPLGFENFFVDEKIYNCWSELQDTPNVFKYDLVSMRIARGANFSHFYSPLFKDIIEAPDAEDTEGVAKVIEYYVSYGNLLVQSEDYKDDPLVVEVVKKLTEKSYGIQRANIMDCLTHFEQTVADYGLDAKALFDNLDGWSRHLDFAKTSVTKMPSQLYEIAGLSDNALSKALHQASDDYYGSLTQGQWKDYILKKDDSYRIWKLYHPKKYQANFDALKALLKDYAKGLVTMPNRSLVAEWLGLCLEVKHSVRGLFNEIGDILKRDSMINKEKLLFFGDWILKYADADRQGDFIEKLIPTEIIDADVVAFIAEHIEQLKVCTIPDDFKEKIKHLAETSMEGDESINKMCDKFGIEVENEEG